MFQGCEAGFFLMEGFLQPCIQTCAWNFLPENIQFERLDYFLNSHTTLRPKSPMNSNLAWEFGNDPVDARFQD
jgi:hypothetical protein